MRDIIPHQRHETVRRIRAENAGEAATAVSRELEEAQPQSVVVVTDMPDALYQTFRYLTYRYERKLAVMWLSGDTDTETWDDAAAAMSDCPVRKCSMPVSKDRLFRLWHEASGWRVSERRSASEQGSMTLSRCSEKFRSEGISCVAVRIGFTADMLSSLLSSAPVEQRGESDSLLGVSHILEKVLHGCTVAGTGIYEQLGPGLARMRRMLSQTPLFQWSNSAHEEQGAENTDRWTSLDRAEVVAGWLADGRSCRALDTWVLGLDGSSTNGAYSRAILRELGIDEDRFRGSVRSLEFERASKGLHTIGLIAELLRSVRPDVTVQKPGARTFPIPVPDKNVPALPPLQKSNRRREYDLYSDEERQEVVYRFLFQSAQHRELDEAVLHLNPLESLGFQSMGILHYLGLKKEYKGYFEGHTVDYAIEQMKGQADVTGFLPIIRLLERLAYRKPDNT